MTIIEKALVIREPWIDLILSGQKTWEMRGQRPAFRGWLGLIRKGSGHVSCIARLVEVGHPLTEDEMIAAFEQHRIPESMIRSGEVAKWTTPWKLADIRVLHRPVPYRHPNGAITLFSLDPAVSAAITAQLGDPTTIAPQPPRQVAPPSPVRPMAAIQKAEAMPVAAPVDLAPGALLGETELNEANLKNNHFYLTPFLGRFPTDMIGGTNERSLASHPALIDWGGPLPVETDIPSDKKMFRRRGWVRQFFADNDAAPGDRVRIHQTAPYRYRVTLVKGAA